MAAAGETVELECHLDYEVEIVDSYFWYKQLVGEAPKLVHIPACRGTICKFTSKRGRNKFILVLQILKVNTSDAASYYCADSHGYALLRNGSLLLVGDSSTPKTDVLVFVTPGEPPLRETIPLVCLVTGVSSRQIAIYWNVSGQFVAGRSEVGTLDPDGTYSIRSHVMVGAEIWSNRGVCTCIVELGSPGKSWSKSVSRPEAATDWCTPILPFAIRVSAILVLVLILIILCHHNCGRREGRDKRPRQES
uniref:uncharacterized protein n=1 Tax=Pristiophorus japonicus TaxID=55135 RepID=UPI00398F428D